MDQENNKRNGRKSVDVEYGEQFKLLCDYKPGDERDLTKITINKVYLTELAKNVGEIMSSEEIDEMISIVGGEDGTIKNRNFIVKLTDEDFSLSFGIY